MIGVAVFREEAPATGDLAGPGRAGAKPTRRAVPPAQAQPSIGTGHGRREDSICRARGIRAGDADPAETVTLYYDSYRNLAARA